MARNNIEEITNYDFINDYSGSSSEIYTYGNFMCSQYDWSEDALDELRIKVLLYYQQLNANKWCNYIFRGLEIRAQ